MLRTGAGRRIGGTALAGAMCVAMLAGIGVRPAAASVSSVSGGAFGYRTYVGLFGGPPAYRGPEGTTNCTGTTMTACSPSVTLPAAGSAPITATDPDGASATYGPAVLHRSASETATTGGTTGSTGSVDSSASVTFPSQAVQDGPLLADGAQSQCTAKETGQSGSTTLTNASLIVSTHPDSGEATSIVTLPANPAPNSEYEGTLDHIGDKFRIIFNEQVRTPDAITVNAFHMFLLGEIAVGEYIVGQFALWRLDEHDQPGAGRQRRLLLHQFQHAPHCDRSRRARQRHRCQRQPADREQGPGPARPVEPRHQLHRRGVLRRAGLLPDRRPERPGPPERRRVLHLHPERGLHGHRHLHLPSPATPRGRTPTRPPSPSTSVNDAPVATDDAYTTAEDTPLTVAAAGGAGQRHRRRRRTR